MQHKTMTVVAGAAALLSFAVGATTVRAADSLPVIELYTSQGCSSCPSADRLFESYAKRTDVVALSLSVDYWDYIGWKDTLASPKYSARQRDYAQSRGDGQVYTPQVIVNGRDHAVGSNRQGIDTALARSSEAMRSAAVSFTVSADGNAVEIVSAGGKAATSTPAIVWLVAVATVQKIKVERGENRGRELTYHNVVREMVAVGTLSGERATLPIDRAKLPVGDGMRRAAIIQSGKGGPLVAAAWLN